MTHIEEVLLGYMARCVYQHFGGAKRTAIILGLNPSTVHFWVQYYNTNGTKGCGPTLHNLGLLFDKVATTINMHKSDNSAVNIEAYNELTTLERAILQTFFEGIHDKYCGDYATAAEAFGIRAQTILLWKAYYEGKGQCGTCTNLSYIAPMLEKLGVTIVERPA